MQGILSYPSIQFTPFSSAVGGIGVSLSRASSSSSSPASFVPGTRFHCIEAVPRTDRQSAHGHAEVKCLRDRLAVRPKDRLQKFRRDAIPQQRRPFSDEGDVRGWGAATQIAQQPIVENSLPNGQSYRAGQHLQKAERCNSHDYIAGGANHGRDDHCILGSKPDAETQHHLEP